MKIFTLFKTCIFCFSLLVSATVYSQSTYFVSPQGNDNNTGAQGQPFRTIAKALASIQGGDLIYLRGGTYYPAKTFRISNASGTSQNRTRIFGFPGERAIVDGSRFTEFDPDENDNDLFRHQSSFWHYKDFEIRNAPSTALEIFGSASNGNLVENLKTYDNGNTGIAIYSGASNTTVLHCDSYRNFDRQNGGQDADGFGAKFSVGPGNKFIGCRAWSNSDDGWDLWMADSSVSLENCWAYKNGFDIWNFGSAFEGNGDGFKFGRGKGAHIVKNCLAWGNDLRGFNSNSNESDLRIYNCTSWDNDLLNYGFNFGSGSFVLRNNLSFQGEIDIPSTKDAKFNSWNLNVTVNEDDFISLSSSVAEGNRPSSNELPSSNFLKLRDNSDLIDKGEIISGVEFSGNAPDLGAFETGSTNPAPSPAPVAENGVGFMEAEDMILTNYEVNPWGNEASGDEIIKVMDSDIVATASYTFTGPSANYSIAIRYRDEIDGASFYSLKIGGTLVHSWTADEVTVAPDTWVTPTVLENVRINSGVAIEIESNADRGEPARLDYVEISTTEDEVANLFENGIGFMEAEDMILTNYEVNQWGDEASEDEIIKVIDSEIVASASYTFIGPSANYSIAIRYRDEIDGASFYSLRIEGNVVHSWTADEVTVAPDTWVTPTVIENVRINSGAAIEIESNADRGEPARLDYIEIKVPQENIPEDNAYYVSVQGNDNNQGTIDSPFRTIEKAVFTVSGGGTVFIREGTYFPKRVMRIERAFGTEQNRTKVFGFPGEKVIIDGSQFTERDPDLNDNNIFRHSSAFWHFKDLELRNCITSAIDVTGSSANGNIFENLNIHDNGNNGLQLFPGASNNLVKNCDSYRNFDSVNSGRDADGFAANFGVGPGNIFIGCRAWANADDGWDLWMAGNTVVIENCWAYKNGFDRWNVGSGFQGDGDGFKFGMGTGSHIIKNSVAWGNDLRGFNSNNNETGVQVYNCTAWGNNFLNFAFSFGTGKYILRNNLSHQGNIDIPGSVDAQFNSWNSNLGVSVSNDDFISLNSTIAEGFRPEDGGLPVSDFLRLQSSSDLINRGTDTADIFFNGSAPDLGAFESLSALSAIADNALAPANGMIIVSNPAKNGLLELQFEEVQGPQQIHIYNLEGKRIKTFETKEEINMTLDISTIPQGLYILKAIGLRDTYTDRFIKQ